MIIYENGNILSFFFTSKERIFFSKNRKVQEKLFFYSKQIHIKMEKFNNILCVCVCLYNNRASTNISTKIRYAFLLKKKCNFLCSRLKCKTDFHIYEILNNNNENRRGRFKKKFTNKKRSKAKIYVKIYLKWNGKRKKLHLFLLLLLGILWLAFFPKF